MPIHTIAPHGLVPAVEHAGEILIESPAIIEWIETRWPEPRLLPASPEDAAKVRSIAALIACDIHPLNNLRVLTRLREQFGADNKQVSSEEHTSELQSLIRNSYTVYCLEKKTKKYIN